jgi:hypothetical protein
MIRTCMDHYFRSDVFTAKVFPSYPQAELRRQLGDEEQHKEKSLNMSGSMDVATLKL